MKNIIYLILLSISLGFLISCNPECENFARVDATITPVLDQGEKQLLITLNIPNFLDNRDLFTERLSNGELIINQSTIVNKTPFEGGYLVKVSEVGEGNFKFYVSDNDCGGFIPINATFECASLAGVLANVTPSVRKALTEIKVTTTPANFLAERQLFIQRGNQSIDVNNPIVSRYIADFGNGIGGRIAKIPSDASGNANILIEDEECGGFIPISSVRVADAAYISANPGLFVTPTPPTIIISPPNIAPPTNVVNTWFSPDNRDYCIWFLPELERVAEPDGLCFREGSNLLPGNDLNNLFAELGKGPSAFADPESVDFASIGSWELPASCPNPNGDISPDFYTGNPVSGIINQETGYVNFVIDRSGKKDASGNSLGLEHYEGNIIQTNTLPEYAQNVSTMICEDSGNKAGTIMLVTSKETGKQMILFRQAVFGISEDRLCR